MDGLKQWKQLYHRRYFKRILSLSISTLILLVATVTGIFYFFVGNNVTKNKYEADMRMLLQIEKNFQFINQLLVNYCQKLSIDPSAVSLMRDGPEILSRDAIDARLKALSSDMVSYAPYIHSIYVYNAPTSTYYAAYPQSNAAPIDVYLSTTINLYSPPPKLMPVLRKIQSNTPDIISFENVLSYFNYKAVDGSREFVDAVILNVEPSWLLDNLYSLNTGAQDWFLLMTSDREFLSYNEDIPFNYIDDIKNAYYNTILENIKRGNVSDMIPCGLGGEQYILSYIYMPDNGFILYRLESFDSVYADVTRVKNMALVISLSITVISLFLAFFISDRIYTPFYQMMQKVRPYAPEKNAAQTQFDELDFLRDTYISSANELSLLRSELSEADAIKYKYYLSRLLVDSGTINSDIVRDMAESGLFHIDPSKPLALILLRPLAKSGDTTPAQDVTVRLAASFDAQLEECAAHDVIDLGNSSVVAIINLPKDCQSLEYDSILSAIDGIRGLMRGDYGVYFSAIISSPIKAISEVSEAYLKLQRDLLYSYTFGPDITITPGLVDGIAQNIVLDYPLADEQKLVAAIMEKNREHTERLIVDILESLKKMNYNNMTISLVNLCNAIRNALNEYNRANLKTEYFDMFDINPMDYNYIGELRSFLLDLVKNCFETDITITKQSKIIDAAKKIILLQYRDPNINLAWVADELRISPSYLNYTFKNFCGISVSDYLTDYRLEKAAELMESTEDSIMSIMFRVGIENESTFYRRFKQKYGVTPKSYIAARVLGKSR